MLLKQAVEIMKSIRGVKALKLKSAGEGLRLRGEAGAHALLDGGATNWLRQAKLERSWVAWGLCVSNPGSLIPVKPQIYLPKCVNLILPPLRLRNIKKYIYIHI